MKLARKINGDRWIFKIVDEDEMKTHREDGEHLAALCVPSERTVYVDHESISLMTVTHELIHAYFSYLYLDDTNGIQLENFEEIMCTFFSSKGEEILTKAKKITKDLIRLNESEK